MNQRGWCLLPLLLREESPGAHWLRKKHCTVVSLSPSEGLPRGEGLERGVPFLSSLRIRNLQNEFLRRAGRGGTPNLGSWAARFHLRGTIGTMNHRIASIAERLRAVLPLPF